MKQFLDDETLLRRVRTLLSMAHVHERSGNIQQADAYGAMAANKLTQVVHRNRVVYQFKKEQSWKR